MGSTSDKIKGHANEAAGNVKQSAGKATGDRDMQAKGKDAVKTAVDKF